MRPARRLPKVLRLGQFLLVLGLCTGLAGTAWAQTSLKAEIRSGQARLASIDQSRAEARALHAQLVSEGKRLKLQAKAAKQKPSSTLARAELDRIKRSALGLKKRLKAVEAKLAKLDRRARTEATALLALYDAEATRGELDTAGRTQRQLIRTRLGLGGDSLGGQASYKQQADEIRQAEANLRRKARVVATRMRELRKQARLAGDVMRTVRDQALFDEEERRITVSRVRTQVLASDGVENKTDEGEPHGAAIGGGGGNEGPGAPPPSDPSAGTQDGTDADGDDYAGALTGGGESGGDWNGSAGNISEPSDFNTRSGAEGISSSGVSMIQSVVSGSRLSSLLDKDVNTLVGESGSLDGLASPEEELRHLQRLRVELLRSADDMAQRRNQLEVKARR